MNRKKRGHTLLFPRRSRSPVPTEQSLWSHPRSLLLFFPFARAFFWALGKEVDFEITAGGGETFNFQARYRACLQPQFTPAVIRATGLW